MFQWDWFNEKNDTRTSQYVDVKKRYIFSNGLVSDMLCYSDGFHVLSLKIWDFYHGITHWIAQIPAAQAAQGHVLQVRLHQAEDLLRNSWDLLLKNRCVEGLAIFYLSIYLSIYLFIYLSIYLSIYIYIYIYLSISISISIYIYLYLYLYLYIFIYIYIYIYIYLSISISISISICVCVFICLCHLCIGRLIEWLYGWLDGVIDWWIDELIDWLIS